MKITSGIEVNKLLPLGTVVSIGEMERKFMIVEYFVKKKNEEKVFDYLGIPWPEGDVSNEANIMFNADSINTIYFYGFVNSESLAFFEDLKNEINKE